VLEKKMPSRPFYGRISPSMRTTDFGLSGCGTGEVHPGSTGRSLLSVATMTLAVAPGVLDSQA
jgi:hypothetical protein